MLFVLAHLFGVLAQRLGQPAVVGYLLAGVVLGPSGLGAAWPGLATFLLPPNGRSRLLGAVVEFALLGILVVLGTETDVPLVRRLGRQAAGILTGGILVPLVAGTAVAYAFGASLVSGDRLAGAVLVGGALGISSLPITARLVDELDIARRDVGQLALATATANDVYGFLLLAAVGASATSGGAGALVRPVAGLVVLLVAFLVFGQRSVDWLLRKVREDGPNPTGSVAVAFGVALAAAAAMQAVGVEAALGAFFAGVAIGRSRFGHSEATLRLRSLSDAILAPLYFSSAGLLIDLRTVRSWERLAALGALLVASIASKALGTALGARFAGLRRKEVAALAALLNGRGAMQVIVATAGLRMGLLSNVAYTSVLVVSIVSSVLVVPALRRLVGDWTGSEEEERRLAHEEQIESSILVREQRLLVPDLPLADTGLVASLLDRAWPDGAELTLLTPPGAPSSPPSPALTRPVRYRRASSHDPLRAALEEARLGYGVVGIALPAREPYSSSLAAQILKRCPVPLVVLRAGQDGAGSIEAMGDVAVATTGATAGIAAEELAASVARRQHVRLHVVHVSHEDRSPERGRPSGDRSVDSRAILADADARARRAGIRPSTTRQEASVASEGILRYAEDRGVDLLVLGTRLRRVGDSPYFGHTVDALLRQSTRFAVAVVAFPDAAPTELDQPYVEREAN